MRRSRGAPWKRAGARRNLRNPEAMKEMDLRRSLRSRAIPPSRRETVAISGDAGGGAGVVQRTESAGAGRVAIAAKLARSREALSREPLSRELVSHELVIREIVFALIGANVPDASSHAVVRPRVFSVRRRRAGLAATTITDRLLVISRSSCRANPSQSISGRRRVRRCLL